MISPRLSQIDLGLPGAPTRPAAIRALERQLAYQYQKSRLLPGREAEVMAGMAIKSELVWSKLNTVKAIPAEAHVLEVGSGAHGLIFFFKGARRIGVDPLATHYRNLFPAWQGRAETLAGFGEKLPFADKAFDVVLSDNVVDHADSPRQILNEIARVLRPGGLLYFSVSVHHPIYAVASRFHSAWRTLGVPVEVTPFADHTVHLTGRQARILFRDLPLAIVEENQTKQSPGSHGRSILTGHLAKCFKRLFFKNSTWTIIARKHAAD